MKDSGVEPAPAAQVGQGISPVGGGATTSPWDGLITGGSFADTTWFVVCSFMSIASMVLLRSKIDLWIIYLAAVF
jgi:hypothetical protein